MPKKRLWSKWIGDAGREFNATSGFAGVGGSITGLAGWSMAAGPVGTALTYGGAMVVAAALAVAVIRSFPPVVKSPADLVGRTIPLGELKNISPNIMTLAVVGPSKVGKTTLKDRLSHTSSASSRTQNVSAYIASFQTVPHTYIAILDGGGERFSQQFKLAGISQCLCIIMDHNSSDVDSTVDLSRLEEHREFSRQIRLQLDDDVVASKIWVRLLINKHDLWVNAPVAEQAALKKMYEDELYLWRQGNRAGSVEALIFSNEVASDVAKFVDKLKQTVAS